MSGHRVDSLREAVEKVRDGYKSQMQFCDIEPLGYFREFVSRIDRALAASPNPSSSERDALREALRENERLRDILDTERYKVAIGVQVIRKAVDGRRWLSEAGRGSYAYDDDRYQQEFGEALGEIDAALEPLRTIAGDWTDCPRDPLRVAANRDRALTASPKGQDHE
jgi:hypothetical protein